MKKIIKILTLILIISSPASAQLFYIAPNTTVVSTPGCDIEIDGELYIDASASYTHNGNTHLTGHWNNQNGWASASSGTVVFHGSVTPQDIMGAVDYCSYFYNIRMVKGNNLERVRVTLPTQAFNDCVLITGTYEVILNLDKFKVNKIVRNSAILENFGIIEIGEP
ncbi:hypothetical protein ACFLSQ_04030 [Bacteroidota bacterium]